MSEFNMPPGVSTNDIPGNNLTPPGIPAVFVEAAKEAGESLEGWQQDLSSGDWIQVEVGPTSMTGKVLVCVSKWGAVAIETPGQGTSIITDFAPYNISSSIRLANRLVKALTWETEGEK